MTPPAGVAGWVAERRPAVPREVSGRRRGLVDELVDERGEFPFVEEVEEDERGEPEQPLGQIQRELGRCCGAQRCSVEDTVSYGTGDGRIGRECRRSMIWTSSSSPSGCCPSGAGVEVGAEDVGAPPGRAEHLPGVAEESVLCPLGSGGMGVVYDAVDPAGGDIA